MGILICGLNGAGKSTIGKALASRLGWQFLDNEDLYFPKEDESYAYAAPRSKEDVIRLLEEKIEADSRFVFAAVKGDYGEKLLSSLDCAILVEVPRETRLARVRARSAGKFGERIAAGGDLAASENAWFAKVESRPEDYVTSWLETLACPIIRIDGTRPVEENVAYLKTVLKGENRPDKGEMNCVQWLFFDLGSTLVDESLVYERNMRLIAEKANIPYETVYKAALKHYSQKRRGYSEVIKQLNLEKPVWSFQDERLYPNTASSLKKLKAKYRLGIIANQAPGVEQRLNAFDILQFFDLILSSAEVGVKKPDKRIFEIALERAKCPPAQAVMIGDRIDNDIVPAKAVGMRTIWIRQGFDRFWPISTEAETPDHIIEDLSGLWDILPL